MTAETNDESRVLDRAAARAAVKSVALMNLSTSFADCPQHELATRLGVTPGRVSQILNGDGNVRMSTLARVLRAVGYELLIDAKPASGEALPLPKREPRRRGRGRSEGTYRYVLVQRAIVGTPDGVEEEEVIQLSRCHPGEVLGHTGSGQVHDLIADVSYKLPRFVDEHARQGPSEVLVLHGE